MSVPASSSSAALAPAAPAPADVIIGRLLSVVGLRAAGVTVVSVEDDGGVLLGSSFVSEARLVTASGDYTVDLSTYPDAPSAATSFQQLATSFGTSPGTLKGIGDRAAVVGMVVVAGKGAQVVEIQGKYSDGVQSRLDKLKATGSADLVPAIKAATAAVQKQAEAVARAAVDGLSGAALPTGPSPMSYLPSGDVDPCTVDVASLDHDDITVTSAPAISDQPPALECRYTFTGGKGYGEPGTGVLAVYTLTAAQAKAAATPTSVGKYVTDIATNSATIAPASYHTVNSSGSRLIGTASGPFIDFAFAFGPAPQKLRDAAGFDGAGDDPYEAEQLMLRIEDDEPKLAPGPQVCEKEVEPLVDGWEPEHNPEADLYTPQDIDETFRGEFGDWCKLVADR